MHAASAIIVALASFTRRRNHRVAAILVLSLLFSAAWQSRSCLAGNVVGGFNLARGGFASIAEHPVNNLWRAYIHLIDRESVLTTTDNLTTDYLDTVDVLALTSLRGSSTVSPLSADEQAALFNFILDGGEAFLSVDKFNITGSDLTHESMLAPFGLHFSESGSLLLDQTAYFTDLQHPIAAGEAGGLSDSYPLTNGASYFDELQPHIRVIARSETSLGPRPVLVEIPAGALGPGSGRVIVSSNTAALHQGIGTIGANIITYLLVSDPYLVPEPSTWAMATSGTLTALGGIWLRRRRTGKRMHVG